jgi:sphingomyelin phosphodiesterase
LLLYPTPLMILKPFTDRRAQDAPHSMDGKLAVQFSWYDFTFVVLSRSPKRLVRNYDHLASLWEYEGWLPEAAAQLARKHYSAYMVRRLDGLRIITLNTDMCKLASFISAHF